MHKERNDIQLLMSLGLNELEAEVYVLLLTQPSLTGYKAAKMLNKPGANVYKAIDALAGKGAVMLEESNNQLCRAVPVSEFMSQLGKGFLSKIQAASQALSHLKPEPEEEKSYQLFSAPLVLERCRRMLQSCTTIAVIDAFPGPLEAIRSVIEETAARGVEIYLQVYRPVVMAGVHLALVKTSGSILEYWSSHQLNVVVDGREHLLALFNQDLSRVHQASWSRNLYVSCMLHAGFSNEHTIHQIRSLAETEELPERLKELLARQKFLSTSDIPGVSELLNRFTKKPV
jgi:sugar-specific transcriptional regulator TrmB